MLKICRMVELVLKFAFTVTKLSLSFDIVVIWNFKSPQKEETTEWIFWCVKKYAKHTVPVIVR